MSECRISFTNLVPADDSTFQIRRYCILQHHRPMRNVYVCEADEDVEDCLCGIMERYDFLDCFHVFTEDLCQIRRFLFFLRDQNPRKEILVYMLGDKPCREDEEPVLDVVDSLRYVASPRQCKQGSHTL